MPQERGPAKLTARRLHYDGRMFFSLLRIDGCRRFLMDLESTKLLRVANRPTRPQFRRSLDAVQEPRDAEEAFVDEDPALQTSSLHADAAWRPFLSARRLFSEAHDSAKTASGLAERWTACTEGRRSPKHLRTSNRRGRPPLRCRWSRCSPAHLFSPRMH